MFSFFKKKKAEILLGAPCKGNAVELNKVNDPVFSEGMMGPGAAVDPADGIITAPADGEINMVFDTLHAVTMTVADGAEILIHVGLDTVNRKGNGFTAFVKAGDKVKKGQKLLEADLEALKADGYDCIIPMVICNADEFAAVEVTAAGPVEAGADFICLKKYFRYFTQKAYRI